MTHGTEGKEFLTIRCAESHESAIDSSEEAKPHHARNGVHRKRENREDPDDKAKHTCLTHCTREDCRERSRSFSVSDCLPAVERENRSLHEECQEEAHEKHVLGSFREALDSNSERDERRVIGNRQDVPESDHHRSRADQRVNRKRHRSLHSVLATETSDENRSRNHHGFEEEEEEHCISRKEGAVHGAHQGEDADSEVAIASASNCTCRNQSHERKAAGEEHHPGGKSVTREVVVDRSLATRNLEPFNSFRRNATACDQGDRHGGKADAHQNGKAGRRLGVFLGRHHHEDGGNERGEDKEM